MVSFSVRRSRLAAAAGCCLVVLLTGSACGTGNPAAGDINDVVDPTPTSSANSPEPVVSPSSNPGPPALPAVAKQDSPAGVQAFVGHYFDLLNYGLDSGDWEPLLQASDSQCDACKLLPVPSEQGKVEGGHWTPGEVSVFTDKDPRIAAAKVPMSAAAGTITAPGASPTAMPANRWLYQVNLVRKDDSWRVLELSLIES